MILHSLNCLLKWMQFVENLPLKSFKMFGREWLVPFLKPIKYLRYIQIFALRSSSKSTLLLCMLAIILVFLQKMALINIFYILANDRR